MTVQFIGDWPDDAKQAVEQVVAVAQQHQSIPQVEGDINLKLVDDSEIEALNKQYNGNAYATDVLTFHYDDANSLGTTPSAALADIVVSHETAARQAEQAGVGLADEIALLALHGILHSLGLDHQDQASQAHMDGLQQDILKQAGISYRDFQWVQ